MCGIIGALGNFSNSTFIEAVNKIKHRGPDFTGYVSVNNNKINNYKDDEEQFLDNNSKISFAHLRLSIIDLEEHSNQPFIKHNKILIFNGEIYNYIELRKELEKLGYTFFTNSDTEVLISSFEAWGEKCVNKFNGMWAFSIYDLNTKKLFLSRDRFGIKPLYYFHSNNLFAFASEIKSLYKIDQVITSPNIDQISHYLFWGLQEVQPDTLFTNIYKLLPGQNMIYDYNINKTNISQYYSLDNIKEEKNSLNTIVSNLKQKFKDSINLRMRADVPVAVSLSGGLDSSSILMESDEISNYKQKTFSIVYDKEHNNIDESKWINIVNNIYKTENHKTIPKYEDLRDDLEEFLYTYDEPIRGTTFFAQWSLMKLIHSKDIKVSLEGQGGDEVFGGYLYTLMINDFLNNFIKNHLNTTKLYLLKTFFYMLFPNLYEKILSYKVKRKLNFKRKIPKNMNKTFRHKLNINSLLKHELSSGIRLLLKKVDRASMHFSIESRVPYLDYKLVEYALSIPSKMKIHNGWTRYLQRKMFDKRLNDEIVWRKNKLGFPTPHKEWVKQLSSDKEIINLIKNSKLLKELDIKIDIEDTNFKWKIINIAIWEKLYWN